MNGVLGTYGTMQAEMWKSFFLIENLHVWCLHFCLFKILNAQHFPSQMLNLIEILLIFCDGDATRWAEILI